MRIAIIDADMIGRAKHRFPNLVSMKISSFHKRAGDDVKLLTNYNTDGFDKVYLSKVFTDTEVPGEILEDPKVSYGGTGFFYDKAPPLPNEIEHEFPDYHLYDEWVATKIKEGYKPDEFKYYTDYSIGFLTRGCFRKCDFCVNKRYDRCVPHSPLSEFFDPERKKICFLDDNFFACPGWKDLIQPVLQTGKRFQFKQGLDERLLTEDKVKSMTIWKYDGAFIFAFDNIVDRDIIVDKLKLFRDLYPNQKKHLTFYVLCGFDRKDAYDEAFWANDVADTFERIRILQQYDAAPYIMRFQKCYESVWSGLYAAISAWVNQPPIFHKFTFREFCKCKGMGRHYSQYKRNFAAYENDGHTYRTPYTYLADFERKYPDIANEYFAT